MKFSKKKKKKSLNSKFSSTSEEVNILKVPTHVAIIMDGNGRWAKKRLLNRIRGHEQGAQAVDTIVETSREIGISVLTLFSFSTENWQRPEKEVNFLMKLLKNFLIKKKEKLLNNNIRLNAIGELDKLPYDVLNTLTYIMDLTKTNDGMILNLALSYGSKAEILHAVKEISILVKKGEVEPENITCAFFENFLYTKNIPDPDILIRTSGEMRISNFLLWQLAYSEIFVTKTLWPDFSKEEYLSIINEFQHRNRRFGKVI